MRLQEYLDHSKLNVKAASKHLYKSMLHVIHAVVPSKTVGDLIFPHDHDWKKNT